MEIRPRKEEYPSYEGKGKSALTLELPEVITM